MMGWDPLAVSVSWNTCRLSTFEENAGPDGNRASGAVGNQTTQPLCTGFATC